jgi:hypothetical protein
MKQATSCSVTLFPGAGAVNRGSFSALAVGVVVVANLVANVGCRLILGIGDVEKIAPADGGGDQPDGNPANDAGNDGSSIPSSSTCVGGGWCWANPLPQGHDILSIWATSPNDIWAVTNQATALHYDGTSFSSSVITNENLPWAGIGTRIWSPGPDRAWVIGGNGGASGALVVWRWDAPSKSWKRTPTSITTGAPAAFWDIWGADANDFWIVGSDNTPNVPPDTRPPPHPLAVHFVNESPSVLSPSQTPDGDSGPAMPMDLRLIRGVSKSDAWAFGQQRVAHWNGSAWSTETCAVHFGTGGCGQLRGSSAGPDLWYFANDSTSRLFRYRNPAEGWQKRIERPFSGNVIDIAATTSGDVWVLSQEAIPTFWRYRDPDFAPVATSLSGQFSQLAATGARSVVAGGQLGRLAVTTDGDSWKAMPGTGGVYPNLVDVAAIEDGKGTDLLAVGVNQGSVVAVRRENPSSSAIFSELPVGTGPGAAQTCYVVPPSTGPQEAVEAWLVSNEIYRYRGGQWTPSEFKLPVGVTIRQIRGRAANDIWAVGSIMPEGGSGPLVGYALHFDGMSWSDQSPLGQTELMALWMDEATGEVWSVGASGRVLRRAKTATTWTQTSTPNAAATLLSISGNSATDLWVAAGETIHHFDGNAWDTRTPPQRAGQPVITSQWTSIVVRGTRVWASASANNLGRAARYLSATGTWEVTEGLPTLSALHLAKDGTVWGVGANGAIMRHGPE